MARGSYLGGCSVVGFSGTFLGTKRKRLTSATAIDPHLTAKAERNAARQSAGSLPKKKKPTASKAERRIEKEAREQLRKAPKNVLVEHRVGGEIVSRRIIQRRPV